MHGSETLRETTRNRWPGDPAFWSMICGDMIVFGVVFNIFMWDRSQNVGTFINGSRHLNEATGIIFALLMLVSSWFVVMALHCARRGRSRMGIGMVLLALASGLAFCIMKRPGISGGGLSHATISSPLRRHNSWLGLGRRNVADGSEQAMVVEPVDPAQGGHLDARSGRPRPLPPDHLGFVKSVDGFSEGIVICVSNAANRRHQIGLGQALGVVHGQVRPCRCDGSTRPPRWAAGHGSPAPAHRARRRLWRWC